MKKYIFLIIIPFIFWGCQKDFNSVLDASSAASSVVSITTTDSFSFSLNDSSIVLSVKVNSSDGIKSVSANVIGVDHSVINNSPVILYDNGDIPGNGDSVQGDNLYSNKFPLSQYYSNGTYSVQYFITDNNNNSRMIAVHSFVYNNSQTNVAPVISNLVMPDTVSFGTRFTTTLKVTDANGQNDIDSVYYKFYRPDGTLIVNSQKIYKFPLYDNGETENSGDVTAGDEIFTMMLTIPTGQQSGTWKFQFMAVDRAGYQSNIITHNVVVK